MRRWFDIFETESGWVGIVASERGVRRATLPQPSPEMCVTELSADLEGAEPSPERLATLHAMMQHYFVGERVDFDGVALDVDDAGPFLKAAWNATRSIPWGETRSYQWVAAQAGRPRAPRAAGQAMARNRVPIIVPCHRVIASDGTLGGYGRGTTGLPLKRLLLAMEGAR